jgi:hypothetical protein
MKRTRIFSRPSSISLSRLEGQPQSSC